MKQWLESLEPIALYKAYNGDDWPARQVAPVITALRAAIEAAERAECVGALTIRHFRGHLENRDFDYTGNLPDGTYRLYAHPPQITDAAVERAAQAIFDSENRKTWGLDWVAHITGSLRDRYRIKARAALAAAREAK